MATPKKVVVKAVNYAPPANTTFFSVSDGLSSQNVFTGNTVSVLAGEGIDTVLSAGNTVTISAELATSSNKGVASFSTNDFIVTSGSVALKPDINLTSVHTTGLSVYGQAQLLSAAVGFNLTEVYGSINSGVVITLPTASGTIATEEQVALKAPLASPTFTGTVSGITKAMVGLGNADNTSDANKPVSTATQTALNSKVANDGNVAAIKKLTQAEYTALGGSVSATTLYIIIG